MVEVLSDVIYRINPGTGKKRRVVHVDHLFKYADDGAYTWSGTCSEKGEEEKEDDQAS